MSNVQSRPGAIRARLIAKNDVQLAGELSAPIDGRLEFQDFREDDELATPDRQTVEIGSYATLSIDASDPRGERLDDTAVRIADVSGHGITLELVDADNHAYRRYRDAIATGGNASQAGRTAARGGNGRKHAGRASGSGASGTLAASAEYTELLETVRKKSIGDIAEALEPFLGDLIDYLLELSSRLRQRKDGENLHYDSAIIIRHARRDIIKQVALELNNYFEKLTPDTGEDRLWRDTDRSIEELGLVDLQEFEDSLLIDRMVTFGEDLFQVQLEALTVRLAELIAADPRALRNPVHVRQLCRAFQRALLGARIPQEVLTHILDYFGRHFIRQLKDYYGSLNELLVEHRVRPGLEKEIAAHGSLLKPAEQLQRPPQKTGGRRQEPEKAQPHSTPGADAFPRQQPDDSGPRPGPTNGAEDRSHSSDLAEIQQQLGPELKGASGRFTPAGLYKSVVDALNFKREAEGSLDGGTLESGAALSGTWDGVTVASSELDQEKLADARAIAQTLGELQRNARAREELQNVESLRAYLANHREDFGELRDSSGLTAESLNQLDMVDNLFGTIRSQLDVTNELKPALANLQIPLAKLALMDPRFFVDRGHTARTVVDKLSRLAASANFPNKALESRINNIVDDIIAEYENDSTVFEEALHKIDRLLAQQERALSRNIERVVRTQEGQEKLFEARRAVAGVIREKISEDTAPKVLIDLIESGLRDTMVLTHVKQGPDSSAWKEQVKNLELLCDWLNEQQASDMDEDRNVQRSFEAEPLLDLIGTQITTALPTNISHESVLENLRNILSGSAEVQSVDVGDTLASAEPDLQKQRARIEDLPRLRRWVRRVEQLENGSWLTYRDKNGQKKRMQLAWTSPNRDRYIFVNERGQKVADLSAVRLARQLSRGMQPPAPADKLSVVDQSMYHTLENVQKTLSFSRNYDSLTRLINRETFLDQMERALHHSRLKHSQHAVLYINIDQFSLVNEVYDRVSGDQVLLEFARLLAQLHGRKSSSARIRADEFGVLLLDRSAEAALELAEKVRRDIEAGSLDIDGENVSFTVSIGVTTIEEHSAGVEEVLEAARSAMQLAKQGGRNRVMQFAKEQDEAKQYKAEKRRTRQNLEEALATDRFVLRAQPIMQTAVKDRTRTSKHYELLLGLKTADDTLASPEDFIHSAERYGFMALVDRWVVREAFSWISQLMDAQKVIPSLAINLSGVSVTDDRFLDYLLEQISEFGVGTSRLCFEITETGTISNLVKAADFVRTFRNIGCKFSIDDFGTGLSSHNYLRELPVDYVKIDGSFIRGIHKNRNDYTMARSINDLAHFLGQETIAESVESEEIVVKLEEIGVDYLQGWGVGKPKLLAEVTDDLSSVEK
ncbi:MAG: DUF1631 family protein [Halioglobus sp.]|nr:DUF1631 family protein [Halioglobus sp.]